MGKKNNTKRINNTKNNNTKKNNAKKSSTKTSNKKNVTLKKNSRKKNNKKENRTVDLVIKIVLIIIIILLLLHNCELRKKDGKSETGKVNIIDITCDKDKCQQLDDISVDCVQDSQNSKCFVPNFVGKTKRVVLKWLNSISNTIEVEIRTVTDYSKKDGTVLEQSVYRLSAKDLLDGKAKLVVTIVNNGSLVDCRVDIQNSKCVLPNFSGKKKGDVENWLDGLANNVNVRYVYINSNQNSGTIVNQSIEGGTFVKDILDKNETLIIYISKGSNVSPSVTPSDDGGEDIPEDSDDDFYVDEVNGLEKVRWNGQSDLNIFEDSLYKISGKIAPESSNTYKFIVNNETRYSLKYKISFSEKNQYGINMKYKLRKGDAYLIDHYVSYDQLNIDNLLLDSNNSQEYYLEWKWVGDDDIADTQIGIAAKTSEVKYSLSIVVEAESV